MNGRGVQTRRPAQTEGGLFKPGDGMGRNRETVQARTRKSRSEAGCEGESEAERWRTESTNLQGERPSRDLYRLEQPGPTGSW